MEILLLSFLCSEAEHERMFKKYGTTLSHAGQKFCLMLLKGFIENGCTVYAVSQQVVEADGRNNVHKRSETENGISYIYLPRYVNRYVNRLMTIFAGYIEICRWHKKHPDGMVVCDILCGELSIALRMAAFFRGIKTTALVTDVPNIRAGDVRRGLKAIPARLKNKLIYLYDGYIFLTEQMNNVLNPNKKPYVVIEGMTDPEVFSEPNTLELKYPEKVCIMAGLLEDIYGVDALINAFQNIHCNEARLYFYGKGSGVSEITKVSALDGRISYKGELINSDMVREEKRATLLINPRPPIGEWTAYSFPSKNMEYIASGTPMLAYDLPCIPREYCSHFFCVDYNEMSLENKLREILEMDRIALHNFGLASQKWILENKNANVQTKSALEMMISMF